MFGKLTLPTQPNCSKVALTGLLFLVFFKVSAAALPPIPNATLNVSVSASPICYGQSADVLVDLSEIGVSYQLIESLSQTPIGLPIMGTGATLTLPAGALFSNTIFEVLATDTSDGMNIILNNLANITVRPGISGSIFPDSIPSCPNTPIDFSFNDWALDVNGSNQYVQIPTSPSLTPTNEITVEAWINADSWTATSQEGVIVSNYDLVNPGGPLGYELRVGNNGVVNFEVGLNGQPLGYEAFTGQLMNLGTWYHIAGTYDGTEVEVYLNGVSLNSTPIIGTISTSSLDLHLGRHASFGGLRFFDGQIDEVRIWDHALTPAQIQLRMNQILGGNEPGLAAYYRANQGPGFSNVIDSSPNGNGGTFVNMSPDTSWASTGPLLPTISSFAWDFGDANTAAIAAPTHTYLTSGTFNSSVLLVGPFGCMTQPARSLTISPEPVVNLGADTSLCGAANIVLDAGNPGNQFIWSTNATTQTISVTVADTYFVAVENLQGCVGYDTIEVLGGTNLVVNLGPDTTLCSGNALVLDAGNAGATYTWSNGSPNQVVTISTPGLVYVDVVDGSNCTGSDSILVGFIPDPGDFLPADTSFCTGDSITLSSAVAANTYGWSNGDLTPTTVVAVPGPIGLTIQDLNDCTWQDTVLLTENLLPTVLLTGAAPAFCFGDPTVTLQGSPIGGSFSGLGVTGAVFDPGAVPAPDTILLSYQYTDPNGCQNADSETVIIRALPLVGFTGLAAAYCDNDAASILAPTPAGGIFTGPGIAGVGFSPPIAGPGNHTISYQFTDVFGCTGQEDQTTDVNPAPNVSLTTPLTTLCQNSAAVILTTLPPGGTLTGNGITGNNFDPGTATLGLHPINYFYTDLNGCSNEDSLVMEVVLQPTAALTGLAPGYCDNVPAATLGGTPAGGTFSGPGITGNGFAPAQAGAGGPYSIVYTYTVATGCSDADTQSVSVFAAPAVAIEAIDTSVCSSGNPISLSGQPLGGTFSGPGVGAGLFDPTAAPVGSPLSILYVYTDSLGCTGADSSNTRVYASPGPAQAGPDQELYFTSSANLGSIPPLSGNGFWEIVNGSGIISDPTSNTSQVTDLAEGSNTFRWKVTNGPCLEEDDITLTVIPFDPVRGFSPNGDGLNETFEIPGLVDFPNSKLQVLDKLGNLILSTDDYQNDWTGLNAKGNELPEDTYYYTLEVNNGVRIKGLILLKR